MVKQHFSNRLPSFILMLLCALAAKADTQLPDTLRSPDQGHMIQLGPEGSPYLADTATFLLPGDTLKILAGTSILFRSSASLELQGTLLIEGSSDSLVILGLQVGEQFRWQGLKMRRSLVADVTRSVIEHAWIQHANIALLSEGRPLPAGEDYCVEFIRCLFTSCSQGVTFLYDGRVKVQNCVFEEISTFSIYAAEALVDARNCVFLPHSVNEYSIGIMLYNTTFTVEERIQYNCFYSGPTGSWTQFIARYNTGMTQYEYLVPDSTSIVADPLFQQDLPYHPDPLTSPLVDSGDPTILDPDLTISDIGVFWVLRELTPFQITSSPTPSEWVVGFPYLARFDIVAYPPPVWTLSEMPPGMQLVQLNRTQYGLAWPTSMQTPGQFLVRLQGYNQGNDLTFRDSLEVLLDFTPNHAPHRVLTEPCPDVDCLDVDEILLDQVSAGEELRIRLRVMDEDAPRLGSAQRYTRRTWLNGVAMPLVASDSLSLTLVLDTTQVVIRNIFSDGLLGDTLLVTINPLFTVLSGSVSGVIGSATGSVFLEGPIHVEAGTQLRIEAGSLLVMGESAQDVHLLDVDGELILEGTAEAPIVFRSLASQTNQDDRRPPFMRLKDGAVVEGLRYLEFNGFSTAIQVEHLDRDEPLPIEHCLFERNRIGVLSVGTPVAIRMNRFEPPRDSLRIGSYGVYLAGGQGHIVQNNLFLNPVVGVGVVDAQALIANNSFLVITMPNRNGFHTYPGSAQIGFGRVHALNAQLELRNNLFQWRSNLYGDSFSESQLPTFLESAQHAVWLDAASRVREEYNWFDCSNGYLRGAGDALTNLTHLLAFNDSTLLLSHLPAGQGAARVDRDRGFQLFADSPLINAGDPALAWADAFDGSRADIGWTGGPLALEAAYTPVDGSGTREPELVQLPRRFLMHAPAPNPFNPATRISVDLHESGLLDVRVYDLLGRELAVLVNNRLEPGVVQLEVDASGWASGTYFARARFGQEQQTQKLLLVK